MHRLTCARSSSTIVSKYLQATNRRCRSTSARRPGPCGMQLRWLCRAAILLPRSEALQGESQFDIAPASVILRFGIRAAACGDQPSKRVVTKRAGAPQSGHGRSKTNREGPRRGQPPWSAPNPTERFPQSLPTPLPRAVSGCNVKPNAKTAATTPAVERLDVKPARRRARPPDRGCLPFASNINDLQSGRPPP